MLVFMWIPYTGHPHQSVSCMRPPGSSDLHAVVSEKVKPLGRCDSMYPLLLVMEI